MKIFDKFDSRTDKKSRFKLQIKHHDGTILSEMLIIDDFVLDDFVIMQIFTDLLVECILYYEMLKKNVFS